MTVADYILQTLEKYGVKDIFYLPGGGALFLVDAISRTKINPVCMTHEQPASIAAEAYAQYKNDIGVLLVTTGPGVTNALTGVAAAYIDSIPMIVLSGQVNTYHMNSTKHYPRPSLRQRGIQEVPTSDIVRPITKRVFTILNAKNAPTIIYDAINLAKSGRPGPVWIDIPLDVQQMEIEQSAIDDCFSYEALKNQYIAKPQRETRQLLEEIEVSKKPVFLIGNGVRLSNSIVTLNKILDKLKIPVLTTWKTFDLFNDDDELYCGRPGMIAQRGPNFIQQESDLLIVLGARLDLGQTAFNYENFAPNAKKIIIIDIDYAELAKLSFKNKVEYCYDLHDFLSTLLTTIHNSNFTYSNEEWRAYCKNLYYQYPLIVEQTEQISLYHLMNVLSDFKSYNYENYVLVSGSSGCASEVTNQAFKMHWHSSCNRVLNTSGLGSMGFGLAESIGAHYASQLPTICIEGDGSFAMNMQELAKVSSKNLPICILLINNGGYNSIINSQTNLCSGRLLGVNSESGLDLPNYEKLANAFNIKYLALSTNEDVSSRLHNILNNFMSDKKPIICELFCNPYHQTQPRTQTYRNNHGDLVSSGMENMWPFLTKNIL